MTANFMPAAFGGASVGLGPLMLQCQAGGSIQIASNASQIRDAVEVMLMSSAVRMDAAGLPALDSSDYLTRMRTDALRAWAAPQGGLEKVSRRFDSGVSAGLGGSEPRDLTFRFPDVLEEALPLLQSYEYFAVDETVPPGAIEFELSRSYSSGEARIYLGGQDVPTVELAQARLRRSTRFLVTSYNHSFIDVLRDRYRGYSNERQKAKAARDVLLRKADDLFWNGDDDFDLWGVINYPFLDVGVSATPISASSSAAAIVEAISEAANYAQVESKQAFESNACIMSTKIYRYLSTTLVGTGDNSTTILEFLQKANPHIKSWRRSYRLDATGPSSYHGILFYRDDSMGINPIITMDPTPLPPQAMGITDRVIMIMGIGGVVMKESGNNLLKWFSIS